VLSRAKVFCILSLLVTPIFLLRQFISKLRSFRSASFLSVQRKQLTQILRSPNPQFPSPKMWLATATCLDRFFSKFILAHSATDVNKDGSSYIHGGPKSKPFIVAISLSTANQHYNSWHIGLHTNNYPPVANFL